MDQVQIRETTKCLVDVLANLTNNHLRRLANIYKDVTCTGSPLSIVNSWSKTDVITFRHKKKYPESFFVSP